MGGFLLRRILLSMLVVFGVVAMTFVMTHVLPSDPASQWAGQRATAEQRAQAERELGLDKSLLVQFAIYVRNMVQGNLGRSLYTRQPVVSDMARTFPATIELVAAAMLFAVVVGIPSGVFSAAHKDRLGDHVSRVITVTAVAMPTFWLGLLLQLVFARWLHILPIAGYVDRYYVVISPVSRVTGFYAIDAALGQDWGALASHLVHLVLPAIALGCMTMALMARMTRSAIVEVLNEDFIVAERSYGLSERVVLWQSALKNAIGPLATVFALCIGCLLVNSFLVEAIFNWPGVGNYIARAAMSLDYPAIIGVTLVSAIAYVALNTVADMVAALDPRVRR